MDKIIPKILTFTFINPLMPGGNRKVTKAYLSMCDLFVTTIHSKLLISFSKPIAFNFSSMEYVENINRQYEYHYRYDFCWRAVKNCITEKSLACNMTKTESYLESSRTSTMEPFAEIAND